MKRLPVVYAVLAAVCYGVSAPAAKLLLEKLPPAFMASMLYLGAGFGMLAVNFFRGRQGGEKEARLGRREWPYVAGMVLLDIAAPIFLMLGLAATGAATVSLLNNFEIAATAVIALAVFKEAVGRRMWLALALITASSAILSAEDFAGFTFSPGAVFVLLACVCWGVENNCTSRLSLKNPLQIVIIKGFGAGLGALPVAFASGGVRADILYIAAALLLGFVAYGLSITFYIRAQRGLGAARTSAYYAFAPFIGVGLSFAVFRQRPTPSFTAALLLMMAGAFLAAFERHEHEHRHEETEHEHRHSHGDGHHGHLHTPPVKGEHSHSHKHAAQTHSHAHLPDLHHTHSH